MNTISINIDGTEYDLILKQKVDRQQVLRGEWLPTVIPQGAPYWRVGVATPLGIQHRFEPDNFYKGQYENGMRFFPTEADALEFLLVEKGEWLPKKGDEYIRIDSRNFNSWDNGLEVANRDLERFPSLLFFPSVGQKDQFISKHQPKDGLGSESYNIHLGILKDDSAELSAKYFDAFHSLMPFCIKHGGRFGMPDESWARWDSVLYNSDTHRFTDYQLHTSVYPTFHFPPGKASAFLQEPGVDSLLRDFFFITKG